MNAHIRQLTQNPVPFEPFLDADEAAPFVKMSPRHLLKLAREGKVPAHHKGQSQRRRWLFLASELDAYEETMPGITSMAIDVIAADGTHPLKAGPCAGCAGSAEFLRLQSKLTTCLSGARLAKDRAADTVSRVMIPEALDYPA